MARRDLAAVRRALRRSLGEFPSAAPVLVACSGGPDSVALAAATLAEAQRSARPAILATVDHQLQPGSDKRALRVAEWARGCGYAAVEVLTVEVSSNGGPEAGARDARYAALTAAATRSGAAAILLGHTRDDQAETVLLGLARGAGARSLAGMPATRGLLRRPLLGLPRETVRAAVPEGAPVWLDPHNTDPAFRRARLRTLMPALADALGEGLVSNLARTAEALRVDADLLDYLAGQAQPTVTSPEGDIDAVAAAGLPAALRTRVVKAVMLGAGVPGSRLSAAHIAAVDALLTNWHGQSGVNLPHGLVAAREHGRLRMRRL